MRLSRTIIAATLLATTALYAATRPAPSQDVLKVAGDSHRVLFENERVRVLAVDIKPGQVAPMHSHPDNVTYFLTDAKLKVTLPDGKTLERNPKASTAGWSDTITHEVQNIGPADFQAVQIELKPATPRVVPTNK